MEPEQTLSLIPVLAPRMLAPHGRGILPQGVREELAFPLLVVARSGDTATRIWLDREAEPSPTEAATLEPESIGLTNRALADLGIAANGPPISVVLPALTRLQILAANADDLPQGASAHVPAGTLHNLGVRGRSSWALVTTSGISAPVKLSERTMKRAGVKMSMLLRTLLSTGAQPVQIAALARPSRFEKRKAALARVRQRGEHGPVKRYLLMQAGRAVWCGRLFDVALERFLRFWLRAPRLAVITTQTLPGDDNGDLVRLHPTTFTALGIHPGDQVIVEWGPAKSAATAFEEFAGHESTTPAGIAEARRVEQTTGQVGAGVPPHLVVRVSAETRRDLGMPATTVIQVRRRLRPLVLRHLNQLTVPLAGVLIAGIAVKGLRGWPLVVGVILAAVIGLSNLRVPRPPRGLWP